MPSDINIDADFWNRFWNEAAEKRADSSHYFVSSKAYSRVHHFFYRQTIKKLTNNQANEIPLDRLYMQRTFTKRQYLIECTQQWHGFYEPLTDIYQDLQQAWMPQNLPWLQSGIENIVEGMESIIYGILIAISQLVLDEIDNFYWGIWRDHEQLNAPWDACRKIFYASILTVQHFMLTCLIPWIFHGLSMILRGLIQCVIALFTSLINSDHHPINLHAAPGL